MKNGAILFSNVVSDKNPKNYIKLYPNPATTEFEVEYTNHTSYSVLDVTGRVINNAVQFIRTGNSLKVNIQNLSNGIYLLKIIDKQSLNQEVIRFVKK